MPAFIFIGGRNPGSQTITVAGSGTFNVPYFTENLRVRACCVACRFGINEWPRATRRHAQKPHRCWRIYTESLSEELARLVRIWKADANHRAATANRWHES